MSGFVAGLFWMARGLGRDAMPGAKGEAGEPDISAVTAVSNAAVKSVGARIADACDNRGYGLRPLAKGCLAEDTGHSEKVVQRALTHLRDMGILHVSEGALGGRGNAPIYRIDINAIAERVPDELLPPAFRGGDRKRDRVTPNDEDKGGRHGKKEGQPQGNSGSGGDQKGGAYDPHNDSTNSYNSAGAGTDARADEPRASSLSIDDWRVVRGQARERFGDELFRRHFGRTSFVDGYLRSSERREAEALKAAAGAWLAEQGLTGIRFGDGEVIAL